MVLMVLVLYKLKSKNDELIKENQKTREKLRDQMTINSDIESKIQDGKKNAKNKQKKGTRKNKQKRNAINDSVWNIFSRHQIIVFLGSDTRCKGLTEQVGVLTTARDAALAEKATLSNDLDAAKAQVAELMKQLEQATNASSNIQSKLDDVSIELSVTSAALETSKAEVLALQASIAGSETAQAKGATNVHNEEKYVEDESDSDMSDSIYELSIRAQYFRHTTDIY